MRILMLTLCFTLSGCLAPALLGVKSYKSGDTEIQFITGMDITAGANGLNNIDNRRGMK